MLPTQMAFERIGFINYCVLLRFLGRVGRIRKLILKCLCRNQKEKLVLMALQCLMALLVLQCLQRSGSDHSNVLGQTVALAVDLIVLVH
jgi:hypothetical protein